MEPPRFRHHFTPAPIAFQYDKLVKGHGLPLPLPTYTRGIGVLPPDVVPAMPPHDLGPAIGSAHHAPSCGLCRRITGRL